MEGRIVIRWEKKSGTKLWFMEILRAIVLGAVSPSNMFG